MTKKQLAKLLGYVNEIREALGLYPIGTIPRGIPEDAYHCPLGSALEGRFGVEVGSLNVHNVEDAKLLVKNVPHLLYRPTAVNVAIAEAEDEAADYKKGSAAYKRSLENTDISVDFTPKVAQLFGTFVDGFDRGNTTLRNMFQLGVKKKD